MKTLSSVCVLMMAAGRAMAQCDAPDLLTHGDPIGMDHNAVAIVMDGQFLLTGANFKNTANGSGSGECYGFAPIGSAWGQAAHMTAVGGAANEYFGSAVGMGGGNLWAVIGASGKNNGNGKAYFFKRDINTNLWGQYDFAEPGTGANSHFGHSVSMNKAGTIAVVAAPYADVTDLFGTTLGAGEAIVYVRTGNSWTVQGDLYQSDASLRHNYDYFGMGVACDGTTVVTGSPNADSPTHSGSGCIHIWERNAANQWTAGGPVYAPDESTDATFGWAVAIHGNTIAVGAPSTAYAGQSFVGTVYMYRKVAGNWVYDGQVNPIDAGHSFGSVISVFGDRMVVGSDGAIGKAYLFRRAAAGQWVLEARYKAPNGASLNFGSSVAIEGTKIAIGDYGYNIVGASQAGATYMYDAPTVGSDSCGGGTPISQGSYNTCTYFATVDGYSTCGTAMPAGPDVWFSYTAPATGIVSIDTQGSSFDTIMSVHSGCPGVMANSIACSDDFAAPQRWSKVSFPVVAGTTYKIRVAGYNTAVGDVQINVGAVGACYANCDGSTANPILNANDFQCFLNKFAASEPSANCDGSTANPILNANDFQCFLNKFAAGCS